MIVGHDGVLPAAVAAVAVAAGARPLLRIAIAALRAGGRALRGLVRGLVAALEASTARRTALGLLGSGAVLLAPSPGAAAAPVTDARADAAAGPRAPHPIEHAGSAARADRTDRADRPGRTAPSDGGTSVVVRPGDSLWGIARRHLPAGATDAQVAEAWPRWWTANRTVIGPDPDLIHPGTRLVVPPRFRSTGTSTSAATAASSFDPDRR